MKDNTKFIKSWEKKRQKGKFKFVLKFCVVMSISLAIGGMIGIVISRGFSVFQTEHYWDMPLASTLGGIIGGIVGSNIRWNKSEEKYRKLKNKIDES